MVEILTTEELDKMRKAGKLVAVILKELRKAAVPGVSTQELDDIAQAIIREAGGSAPCVGYGDPPFPAAIRNPGDGPCGVVVTFRAEGGDVVSPVITAGEKFIRCPLTLADGDEMEIDTRPRRKTITVNGERVFVFERDSTFFQLPPGTTVVTVGAAEGEDYLKARIAFTPIYYGM